MYFKKKGKFSGEMEFERFMKCTSCNTETICEAVDYPCNNKIIGNVIVPLVHVEKCPNCGRLMLSEEAEIAVSHYLQLRERDTIASLPADDLISAGQAAEILGVTKQAFSKSPKIKKGFVYFTYVGTKKFFFRSSLKLFKTTGDGRFPITKWKSSVDSGHIAICDTVESRWQQIRYSIENADDAAYTSSTSL